jgi:Rieske Fe-S protein
VADSSITRRTFLVRGGFTVAAGVVGYVVAREKWSGASATSAGANGYGAPAAGAAGGLLAPLSSVPEGGGIVIPAKGVVLTRDQSGAVHGFSSICTHQGCTLARVASGTIDCPCHGSQFNAATGAVVHGPATIPLPKVAVVVRGTGIYRA